MYNHPVSAIDCQGDRTSRNSVSWYIKQIKSEIVIKHFNHTFWSLCNISSHVIYLVSHAKYIWFLCRYSSYCECFMQLFLLYMFCIIDKRWILILYLFTMITRIIVKRNFMKLIIYRDWRLFWSSRWKNHDILHFVLCNFSCSWFALHRLKMFTSDDVMMMMITSATMLNAD